MRILLIDESRDDCAKNALLLNHQGFDVVPAHDVEGAWEILSSRSIDLVLSDVTFSGRQGVELYEAIKAEPSLAKLQVIFMHKKGGAQETMLKAGDALYLEKPISKASVLGAIHKVFPEHKIFFKERNVLFSETDMDQAGVSQMLDEFTVALKTYVESVERNDPKSTLRANLMNAFSYCQMIGTDDLTTFFQHYMNTATVDHYILKEEFIQIEKQIIQTKKRVLGSGSDDDENVDDAVLEHLGNPELVRYVDFIASISKQADAGDTDRQLQLAMIYLYGTPELRHTEVGVKWLKEAASHHQPEAICHLALYTLANHPNPGISELRQAHKQLVIAKQHGQHEEIEFWKKALEEQIEIMEKQPEEDQKTLPPFKPFAKNPPSPLEPKHALGTFIGAYHNNSECQYWLGQIYERGRDFPPQMMLAAYWLDKVGSQGNVEALYHLGILFQQHRSGYPCEEEKALTAFEKASQQNHLLSQYSLAKLYHNGVGTEVDLRKARFWYEKAAKDGQPLAQYWVGALLEETANSSTDIQEALKWYFISADNGSTTAKNQIPVTQKKLSRVEIDLARMAANRFIVIQKTRQKEKDDEAAATPPGATPPPKPQTAEEIPQ